MADRTRRLAGGPSRRRVLASTAGLGALAFGAAPHAAARSEHDDGDDGDDGADGDDGDGVDQPEGFGVEVVAPHASFAGDVAAAFAVRHDDADETELGLTSDASTVLVARVTVEPNGTSGWHVHPGPVIVTVVEGEIDITIDEGCTTRTYGAGEAFLDTGNHAEVATNPSETDPTVLYAVFLGVPDGESPTTWVEPLDC